MQFGVIDLLLEVVPLWLIAILFALLCLFARQFGIWLRRKYINQTQVPSLIGDYIVGAIFGLLAFVMGLTFAIVEGRYEDRKDLVREEADTIRAVYTAASVLDEPFTSRVQTALLQYTRSRIAPDGLWNEQTKSELEVSRRLRLRVLQEVRSAVLPIRETDLATYLVEAENQMVGQAIHRELVGREHLPSRIFELLLLYTLVSAVVIGLLLDDNARATRYASSVLLFLYIAALIVIIDLDRPQDGAIRVSQEALESLLAFETADEAGNRSRPAITAPAD